MAMGGAFSLEWWIRFRKWRNVRTQEGLMIADMVSLDLYTSII